MERVAGPVASPKRLDKDCSSGWNNSVHIGSFDPPLAPNECRDACARGHGHRPILRWNPHFLVKRAVGIVGLETGGEDVYVTPPVSNDA